MTKRQVIASLLGVLAVGFIAAWAAQKPAASQDGISVYFSPDGGCTDAIIEEIGEATDSILVQAYSFTSAPIAKAILGAHQRGVKVKVVLDSSQRTAQYSSATFFFNQGVAVYIDASHAIAHNKLILIDDETIITGSFNFSRAAEERNAENLVVIEGKPTLMRAYKANFRNHLQHSPKYSGLSRGSDSVVEDEKPRPTDDAANIIVHVTRTGKKYHRAGCRYLSKSDVPISLKNARGRGYSPCKVCKP